MVFVRLEVGAQRFDEGLGHLHFAVVDLDVDETVEFFDVGRIDHFIRIGQRGHHEPTVLGTDRCGVLLVAHHEPPDRDLAARLHRTRQENVRLRSGIGCQVVCGVEVDGIDLFEVDELFEIDRLRRDGHERLELVGVDHDVATL